MSDRDRSTREEAADRPNLGDILVGLAHRISSLRASRCVNLVSESAGRKVSEEEIADELRRLSQDDRLSVVPGSPEEETRYGLIAHRPRR